MLVFAGWSLIASLSAFGIAVSRLPDRYPAPKLARSGLLAIAAAAFSQGLLVVLDRNDYFGSDVVQSLVILLAGIMLSTVLFICGLYMTRISGETYRRFSWRPVTDAEAELTGALARACARMLIVLSLVAVVAAVVLAGNAFE